MITTSSVRMDEKEEEESMERTRTSGNQFAGYRPTSRNFAAAAAAQLRTREEMNNMDDVVSEGAGKHYPFRTGTVRRRRTVRPGH